MRKVDIISQLRKALELQPGIMWAYLYGSFLTEDKFADLDLAVFLNPAHLKKYPSLLKEEQRLGISLEKTLSPRREIDLKILNRAPLHFQYKIMKTGKLIFFRDPAQVIRHEGETISAYLDYKPTLQFFEKALRQRIDRW